MASTIHNYRSGISMTLAGTADVDYAVETLYHDAPTFDAQVVYIKAVTAISFSHNSLNVYGRNIQPGSTTYKLATNDEGLIRYWVDGDLNQSFNWTQYGSPNGANRIDTTAPAFTASLTFATLRYPAPAPVAGTLVLGATGNNGADILDSNAYFTYGLTDSVGDEWHTITTWDDDSLPGARPGDNDWWASDGKMRVFVVNPKTPCLTWEATGTGQFYTTPAKIYFHPKINDQQTYFQAGTGGTVSVTIRAINGNNVFYRFGTSGSFTNAGASFVTLNQDNFAIGTNTLQYYYAGNDAYIKTRIVVKNPAFPSANETHGLLLWGSAEKKARWVEEVVKPTGYGVENYFWKRYKTGEDGDRGAFDAYPAGNRYYTTNALIHALLTDQLGQTAVGKNWNNNGELIPFSTYAKKMLLLNTQRLDSVGQQGPHAQDANPTRELFYRGYYDAFHVRDLAFGYDVLINCFKSTQHPAGITPIEDYYIRDLIGKACLNAAWEQRSLTSGGAAGGMWDLARRCAAICGAIAVPDYDTPYYGKSGFNNTTTGGYAWAPFRDSHYTWKQLFFDNNMPMTQYPNYSARMGIEDWMCLPGGVFNDRAAYMGHMGNAMSIAATMLNRFDGTKKFPNLEACLVNSANGVLDGTKWDEPLSRHIIPTGYNKSLPTAQAVGVPYLQATPAAFGTSTTGAPYQWGFYDSQITINTSLGYSYVNESLRELGTRVEISQTATVPRTWTTYTTQPKAATPNSTVISSITGLALNTRYFVRFVPYNTYGDAAIFYPDLELYTKPHDPDISNISVSENTFTVNWTTVVSPISGGFNIKYRKSSDTLWTTKSAAATARSYTATNLQNAQLYNINVLSYNRNGDYIEESLPAVGTAQTLSGYNTLINSLSPIHYYRLNDLGSGITWGVNTYTGTDNGIGSSSTGNALFSALPLAKGQYNITYEAGSGLLPGKTADDESIGLFKVGTIYNSSLQSADYSRRMYFNRPALSGKATIMFLYRSAVTPNVVNNVFKLDGRRYGSDNQSIGSIELVETMDALNNFQLKLNIQDDNGQYIFNTSADSPSSVLKPALGTTAHIAVVIDTNSQKIYYNGAEVASSSIASTKILRSPIGYIYSSSQNNDYNAFTIDEISIFNKAFTADQISTFKTAAIG